MIAQGPGPVNCLVKYHDNGTIRCYTHGVDLKDEADVRKHILESNVEWHQQQDALEAMKHVSLEVDWDKLAKEDPQKFGAAVMREVLRQREGPYPIGFRYTMQFPGGDSLELTYGLKTFEEIRDWILKAREVFRKGDL